MIELVIRLQDGQPIDHPIVRENFDQCWPDLDFDNPGPGFAPFQRLERPVPGVYEIVEDHGYRWNGQQVENHWVLRVMTDQERSQKQQDTVQAWNNFYPSWIFDAATCAFVPPVARPMDDKLYRWDEPSESWVQINI